MQHHVLPPTAPVKKFRRESYPTTLDYQSSMSESCDTDDENSLSKEADAAAIAARRYKSISTKKAKSDAYFDECNQRRIAEEKSNYEQTQMIILQRQYQDTLNNYPTLTPKPQSRIRRLIQRIRDLFRRNPNNRQRSFLAKPDVSAQPSPPQSPIVAWPEPEDTLKKVVDETIARCEVLRIRIDEANRQRFQKK
jgi:hypothetical protein